MNVLLIPLILQVLTLPDPVFITQMTSEVTISHDSPALGGQLLVVELEVQNSCAEPIAMWQKREMPVLRATRGYQILVPIASGQKPGEHTLTIHCDELEVLFPLSVEASNSPVSKLKVNSRFTKKPPARTRREKKRIRKALSTDTLTRYWRDQFIKPTAGSLTSPFGVRREFNGRLKSRHGGIDWDGAIGESVLAANDGVVVLKADNFFYIGNAVIIDHGERLFTLYFHMNSVDVVEGQRVKRGQVIGGVGKTGRVTGPHLHFGTKLSGVYFNPVDLLEYQPPRGRTPRVSLQGAQEPGEEEIPANL